jgi:hypothetical protein
LGVKISVVGSKLNCLNILFFLLKVPVFVLQYYKEPLANMLLTNLGCISERVSIFCNQSLSVRSVHYAGAHTNAIVEGVTYFTTTDIFNFFVGRGICLCVHGMSLVDKIEHGRKTAVQKIQFRSASRSYAHNV